MIDIQRKAAKEFAERWNGQGYEKGQSQPFWMELLQEVYGVDLPASFISFEGRIKLNHTSFIDGYIAKTKVLIEQKSSKVDLRTPIKQSDGTFLTPFQQAKRYASEMKYSEQPRWIVVCNFRSFLIYDMEQPQGDPFEVLLENLEREYNRLSFLVSDGPTHLKQEKEVSFQAGELIGRLYNALLPLYRDPESAHALKSLNVLCVRLVFCLYSEDAGLFGNNHSAFYDYLKPFDAPHAREALMNLFHVLDTPFSERDPYLLKPLCDFPYVNGGLFHDEEPIEIPNLTDEILDLLLEQCSSDFDWSLISPTIFGAVFESTLNPETRRSGAMHYTSLENIHKVIDALFLDDLKAEFEAIKKISAKKTRNQKLFEFQQKLASLKFLDPACGSGNFLTETYLSLRRIENELISTIYGDQPLLNLGDPIRVSISQFYGIEINDFAVSVAATALWIAEAQMWNETENLVAFEGEFLPLSTNNNLHHKNAFECDWNDDIVSALDLDYIIGNPPFFGARVMTTAQKRDVKHVFGNKWKNQGELDYVSCWFYDSLRFMLRAKEAGRIVKAGLVATNSVSQGEQVAILWKPLFDMGLHIDFAYRTFRWDSEASDMAHVHCVIIGFSAADSDCQKFIEFSEDDRRKAENINGYLLDKPNVFFGSRQHPISDVPEMSFGNMPNDGGHLSKYTREQRDAIIANYPDAEPLFHRFVGADEFLKGTERWCLWLKDVAPDKYTHIKPIMEAINSVKTLRQNSPREATQKLARVPMLFGEIRQPDSRYLLVPQVTSEKREYVPIDIMPENVICSNLVNFIPDATLFQFGVLQSNVHMIWMRLLCGRLETRLRYSIEVVYNNFPWPQANAKQMAKIEKTAQAILDARAKYSTSTLKQLYGTAMPPELVKAHQDNDRAVMEAYGMSSKNFSDEKCLERLFEMFNQIAK